VLPFGSYRIDTTRPKGNIMKPNFKFLCLTLTAGAAAVLTACGGGGGSPGSGTTPLPPPTTTMGTLGVGLTDAPACGFDAVNITVSKVRVHQSSSASDTDAGWSDITLSPAKKINLLSLTNGVLESLGTTTLAAGRYTQVRLVLDPNANNTTVNSVIPTGTSVEQPLETPSAVQSGIKLTNEFDVVAGQRTDLVLDFDACKSVVTRGNGKYALRPVVKVIPTAVNGINGFVAANLLGSRVSVSAQQNGNVIASTVPSTTGEFFLSRLAPGNYDVVITADGRATAVVAAVPVTSTTGTINLSTATAPITLRESATSNISGTVSFTPASTDPALVSAKQSFVAGPTVTVKYVNSDLLSGAYTLTQLPRAEPSLATYAAGTVLVFTPALTVTPGAGKYKVDVTAPGYVAQSNSSVDVSTANRDSLNFALVK
jgi:hypothetical protein